MESVIYFHPEDHDYGFLSNFYPAPIEAFGLEGPTVEHIYQATKFLPDPKAKDYIETILNVNTPTKAKCLGLMNCPWNYGWTKLLKNAISEAKEVGISIDKDWEVRKSHIMTHIIMQKFQQNPDLREKLLATGKAQLVEHSKDVYWGDGLDGTGLNQLGNILMTIRESI